MRSVHFVSLRIAPVIGAALWIFGFIAPAAPQTMHVYHGFVRSPRGAITRFSVSGATATIANAINDVRPRFLAMIGPATLRLYRAQARHDRTGTDSVVATDGTLSARIAAPSAAASTEPMSTPIFATAEIPACGNA